MHIFERGIDQRETAGCQPESSYQPPRRLSSPLSLAISRRYSVFRFLNVRIPWICLGSGWPAPRLQRYRVLGTRDSGVENLFTYFLGIFENISCVADLYNPGGNCFFFFL